MYTTVSVKGVLCQMEAYNFEVAFRSERLKQKQSDLMDWCV
jgi:hypothetical protein